MVTTLRTDICDICGETVSDCRELTARNKARRNAKIANSCEVHQIERRVNLWGARWRECSVCGFRP